VLFIDIDNFKQVNDSLGHDAGDELLKVLAGRLTEVMGADVFRVGGDEFVAVREDLDSRSAEAVAAAVVAALGPPVQIGAHRFPTGASVGLARSEPRADGRRQPDDPQLLLRRSDLALYRAKELGRGQWAAYEPWLQERADRRLTLQQGLREALERQEFEVFYQPVHALSTGALIGAEALVRWVSPAFGVLLPHEFVPLAREAALMPALGEVVLDTVLGDVASGGGSGSGLWVAVNLSEDEVLHPTLSRRLTSQLNAYGVPPERLRLEVTERVVLDPTAREVLNGLAEAGLGMTIEDFGSGPTSLRHLSSFRKLTLKMDRSFLGAVGRPRDDLTILGAMVGLAHELGLTTAAEAITTSRQAEDLMGLGVDEGQGWHFGQAIRWSELVGRDTIGGAP
jgi:diguanylate cyclase (GGDEF)-like protein